MNKGAHVYWPRAWRVNGPEDGLNQSIRLSSAIPSGQKPSAQHFDILNRFPGNLHFDAFDAAICFLYGAIFSDTRGGGSVYHRTLVAVTGLRVKT